jgi:DNA-formamidopyrimidine glycosylase
MPEGPEVRTVADKLRPVLVNKIITNSYVGERANTAGFFNLKYPATIIGTRSHGKKIIIDLNTGHMIIISLGMVGRLQMEQGNHSHVRLDISDYEIKGSFKIMKNSFSLYFDDYRYMGGVDVIPNNNIQMYFVNIGPDILQLSLKDETWISLDNWIGIFCRKKLRTRTISDILLDQSFVSGIGNYLRAEILYYSRINPKRTVNSLTKEEWDRIRICSHNIIKISYSYGGFTIKSFISPDGEPGRYPAAVYGKTHDPLGNPVEKIKTKGGQTIHWVPSIQM